MNFDFSSLIYVIPAVMIAFSVHEFAHAFMSYKLGDRSQKERGRLTLNPLKHLDPMGTIALVFFGFGWAKPVQVDPYFYKNKKEGMIWTAIAGPLSNFVVAFIATIVYGLLVKFNIPQQNQITWYIFMLLGYIISLNIGLGILNMIPIPPLDGSKVLMGILPEESYFKLMKYEMYFSFIIVLVFISGILTGPLVHARSLIIDAFLNIVNMFVNFM